MLAKSRVVASLPATNLGRARAFYKEKLRLKEISHKFGDDDAVAFKSGMSSKILIYKRDKPLSESHTQVVFYIRNLEKAVRDLKSRGVEFVRKNTHRFETDTNHIATRGKIRVAWFNDSEGNTIGLAQHK